MKKTVAVFASAYLTTTAVLTTIYTLLTPYHISDVEFWLQSAVYIGGGLGALLVAILVWLLPSIVARAEDHDYFGPIMVINIMSAPIAVMGLFTPAVASMIVFALALIVWTVAMAWSFASCGYSENDVWVHEVFVKEEAEKC